MPGTDHRQLTDLAVLFSDHGIHDRAGRLRLCSDHVGRHVTSMRELTSDEADALRARLRALPAGTDLRHAVAQLVADEENEAALRAARSELVCARGGISDHDRAQVEAFGRFLDRAGPPPAVRIGVDLARDGDDVIVTTSVDDDGQLRLEP